MTGGAGALALGEVRRGGKLALAAALARLEQRPDAPESLALLDAAHGAARAHVIGVTGPPGVGKSTLLGALIGRWRGQARSVGAVAVDPSSRRSGGALLGDRLRLATDPDDAGVFVRSMAARDRLGGLAEQTSAAVVLMRAIYDLVVVETVGVGQSEAEIADTADTIVLCLQPGSGDSLQFMKAGIAEIPDIAVVTKADMVEAARRAAADFTAALDLAAAAAAGWRVPVLTVSAARGLNLDGLSGAIGDHWGWLAGDGRLAARRRQQAERWLQEAVRDRFGREGLRRVGEVSLAAEQSPFRRLAELSAALSA